MAALGICRRHRPYWRGWIALCGAWLALAVGCKEELGPVVAPTTRVVGVVRVGGRPVEHGWIEFSPLEGTVGHLRSSPIARDGTFEVTGVAVGKHVVGLVGLPKAVNDRFGPVFLTTARNPIRRSIAPGDVTRLEIDLLEESIRRQQEKDREEAELAR